MEFGPESTTTVSPSDLTPEEFHSKFGALVTWRIKVRWQWALESFSNICFDDMQQEGFIGLMDARNKHDPSRGQFSTCATIYIDKYIQMYVRQNCSPGFRTPTYSATAASRKAGGSSAKAILRAMRTVRFSEWEDAHSGGTDNPASYGPSGFHLETFMDLNSLNGRGSLGTDPTQKYVENQEFVQHVLARLRSRIEATRIQNPERMLEIFLLRAQGELLPAIAKRYGLSRQRVNQIEEQVRGMLSDLAQEYDWPSVKRFLPRSKRTA